MFTFLYGLIAIKCYEFFENRIYKWIGVLLMIITSQITNSDYGIFGICLIMSFYIFKDNKLKMFLASLIVVSSKYLYRILILGVGFTKYPIKNWICTIIPLVILLMYNRKKGPGMKWFFYIFYPIHFLVLYVLSPYTFNLLNI